MSPKKNRSTSGQRARDAQAAGATEPYNVLRRAETADDRDDLARAMARDFAPQPEPAAPLWEPTVLKPWTETTLVRIDDDWDREKADRAGGSRFAAYVRRNTAMFEPFDADNPGAVEFACAAWRAATGPVMAPGYIRIRPDLRRITLHQDDWDGALVVRVAVPLRHHLLAARRLPGIDDWATDRYQYSGDDYLRLQEPDPERARQSAILTTAEIHHRAKGWPLHTPAVVEGPGLAAEAHAALLVLVEHINAEVGPLVDRLLNGTR